MPGDEVHGVAPNGNTQSSFPCPVADIVLSLIKDGRYQSSLVGMLSDVIDPWINRYGTPSGIVPTLAPELELLASALHWSLVRWGRGGRSLGMDHVGIDFHKYTELSSLMEKRRGKGHDKDIPASRHDIASDFLCRPSGESSIIADALGGSRIRAVLFSSIHILVPYVLRRALRGGWGDLSPLCRATNGLVRGDRCGTRHSHNEDLRGSARRLAFEDQRRRMINRARESDDGSGTPLRASDDETIARCREGQSACNLSERPPTPFLWLLRDLKEASWLFIQKVANASTAAGIAGLDQAALNPRQESGLGAEEGQTNEDGTVGALKWMMRLHLALFYINGKYHSAVCRVFRVRYRGDVVRGGTASRPSFRLIGILVVLEMTAAALQASARLSANAAEIATRWWKALRSRHFLERNGEEPGIHLGSPLNASVVERRVPSTRSMSLSLNEQHSNNRSRAFHATSSRESVCGICLNRRKSPSAALCGHVFCWDCILNWTTNVREECPLCRTSSRPQDILSLYHY